MKKFIVSLLIMAILVPSLSVSAAKVGGASGEPQISTMSTETRYDASQLTYEIRNENDVLVETNILSRLTSSTPTFIVDMYTSGSAIYLKPGHKITIYPTGTSGFYVPWNKHYYVYSDTGSSNTMAVMRMILTDQGTDYGYRSAAWADSNGIISQLYQNQFNFYGSNGSEFKLEIYNVNPNEHMYIYRLNFVSYDF